MKNAKELLSALVEKAEKIIIQFNIDEKEAVSLLSELKSDLSKNEEVESDMKELYETCVYNALATINTSFEQERKNHQLIMAITEAKEEMKAIMEFMPDIS